MAAPTGGGSPSVAVLKEYEQALLISALDSMPGLKDLIIDPSLMKLLDKLAGASLLKRHGADKIYKLEPSTNATGERRIYLSRPALRSVKMIADHINSEQRSEDRNRKYRVFLVPQSLCICEKLLEDEGVLGLIDVMSLRLGLIPVDKDILSLELDSFFISYFVHGDQTLLQPVARSIAALQKCFGLIPNIYGQGTCAKKVFKLLDLVKQEDGDGIRSASYEIGHMILIDRDVDYVTPLCSQVTYEGLLDDIFGIHCGVVEFGTEVTGTEKSVKVPLTSEDEIYEEIRNKHFTTVFSYLSSRAKELQRGYDKRHAIKSVGEMKDFVSNDLKDLKQLHRSLALHISACEVIMSKKTAGGDLEDQLQTEHSLLEGTDTKTNYSYIEECIFKRSNLVNTLRLLCLASAVNDGLPKATHEALKSQFLQSYGYQHLLTFHNLRQLGLLVESQQSSVPAAVRKLPAGVAGKLSIPKKSAFQGVSKKLNLIPKSAAELDLRIPTDMAYVFSGAYTPLSCKLVEQILHKQGFSGLEDVTKLLQGESFTASQGRSSRTRPELGQTAPNSADKTVLVYFLGGVTYSEVAALRLLGRLKGYNILVAGTNMVNGNQLIKSLLADT